MATERGLELERAITHSLSSEEPIAKEIPVKPSRVTKAPARVSCEVLARFISGSLLQVSVTHSNLRFLFKGIPGVRSYCEVAIYGSHYLACDVPQPFSVSYW